MIGCRVTSISCLGRAQGLDQAALGQRERVPQVRRRRLRGATSAVGATAVGSARRSMVRGHAALLLVGQSVVAGAGEGEEHLVQAGQVQGEFGRRAMPAACSRSPRSAGSSSLSTWTREPVASVGVSGVAPVSSVEDAGRASSRRAGSDGRTDRRWPPTIRLSPSGVSWAMTRPWSMTRDLVGERVGLLEVLRGEQHGRAVVDELADDVPHVLALGRVEAGGRLVEEDHRRAGRPGWRPGRGGGACRRSRSWPAGRRPR